MSLHLFPTATHGTVDLANPQHEQLHIVDIAWNLAQLNRFYGSCHRPYSVAEHSLLVCDILEQRGLDAHAQMMGLMHDAHEAFCGDLHPWTKRIIGSGWTFHEHRLAHAVRTAFWLHTAYHVHADAVDRADKAALACELRDLKSRPDCIWHECGGQQAPAGVALNTPERAARRWDQWRDDFVARFHALETQRRRLLDDAHMPSGYGRPLRTEAARSAAHRGASGMAAGDQPDTVTDTLTDADVRPGLTD